MCSWALIKVCFSLERFSQSSNTVEHSLDNKMCKRHFTYVFSPRTPSGLLIRMAVIMFPAVFLYLYAGLNAPIVTTHSGVITEKSQGHAARLGRLHIHSNHIEIGQQNLATIKMETATAGSPINNPAVQGLLPTTNAVTQGGSINEVTQAHTANQVTQGDTVNAVTVNVALQGTIIYTVTEGPTTSAKAQGAEITTTPYVPPKNLEFKEDSPVINLFQLQTGKRPEVTNMVVDSACPLPKLELNDSTIMQYYIKYPRLSCTGEADWVTLSKGVLSITKEADAIFKNITCNLFPIVKESDFKVVETEPLYNVTMGSRINHDFYKVECIAASGARYRNYHAGIRHDETIQKREVPPDFKGLDVDVIMLGLDSVSWLAWQRHLPLTRDFFVKVLKGIEMEGYNIVGDGTPAALIPMLTGHREEELPEARRGYAGAKPMDNFPWIWKDFRQAGFVTAFAEDSPHIGTFQFRLLGFNDPPTDHYFRYFALAIQDFYYDLKIYCMGSKPRHSIFFDYMKDLLYIYPNKRKWMMFFHTELSHDDNNKLSKMDDDLYEMLKELYQEKRLDNAILIMFADHGSRFSKVRTTAQGKQEERLPYFGIRFPEWFESKYPAIVQNVRNNTKRLTTPFDVHETLHEILHFTGTEKANISNRGVSMFKAIPEERDCNWAHVDPHWCACLEWQKVNLDEPILKKVTRKIINTFNNYTKSFRKKCAVLEIKSVNSAVMMKAKDAVLKFKDTSDGGRGRFGKMDDNTEHSKVLYQVILATQPGDGLFEVTVTHHIKDNKMELDKKDISRTNKYGNASHCVEREEPFLRPYCYCKDLIKS